MAEVEVQMFTTTEKKVRKVKKTSKTRRESSDQGISEVTITEVENKENQQNHLALNNHEEEGYVQVLFSAPPSR